jgi:hypothetical protein
MFGVGGFDRKRAGAEGVRAEELRKLASPLFTDNRSRDMGIAQIDCVLEQIDRRLGLAAAEHLSQADRNAAEAESFGRVASRRGRVSEEVLQKERCHIVRK